METTIYKPSIYNGAGIYKIGAGGGGGGEKPLPDTYELLDYIENSSVDPYQVAITINDPDINKINRGAGDVITHINYLPQCGNNDPFLMGFLACGRNIWNGNASSLGTCGCCFGVADAGGYVRIKRAGWPGTNDNREYVSTIWGAKVILTIDENGSNAGSWHNNFGNADWKNEDLILQVLQRSCTGNYGWDIFVKTGIKFYSFVCERNGETRLKFLPVKRISDGVLGVWEYVSEKFFPAPSSYVAGEFG